MASNKKTIEKNSIKSGKVKYFEPIIGKSYNYLLGGPDPISSHKKPDENDKYKIAATRVTYNTNPL